MKTPIGELEVQRAKCVHCQPEEPTLVVCFAFDAGAYVGECLACLEVMVKTLRAFEDAEREAGETIE